MHLVCSRSTVLEIQAADFGESAALICGKNEESNQLCRLSEKTGIVKTRCDGKPQCYISALRSIFGDPCLGFDKQTDTSIYLNVMYACGKFPFTGFFRPTFSALFHSIWNSIFQPFFLHKSSTLFHSNFFCSFLSGAICLKSLYFDSCGLILSQVNVFVYYPKFEIVCFYLVLCPP